MELGWNRVPEQAGTTNPDVVRALVELAYTAGAKKVIVMDNTLHKAEDAYSRAITLPLFPRMSDRDADDVVAAVRKVALAFRR